jgi:hypothetical protein
VNATCQEQCQESSFAQCRSELASQCTTQCQQSIGAIFCNGSYISASDVEACIQELNTVLTVKIDASGSSSCTGNDCTGKGSATVSCAAAPVGTANGSFWAAVTAVLAAAMAGARRRHRR